MPRARRNTIPSSWQKSGRFLRKRPLFCCGIFLSRILCHTRHGGNMRLWKNSSALYGRYLQGNRLSVRRFEEPRRQRLSGGTEDSQPADEESLKGELFCQMRGSPTAGGCRRMEPPALPKTKTGPLGKCLQSQGPAYCRSISGGIFSAVENAGRYRGDSGSADPAGGTFSPCFFRG